MPNVAPEQARASIAHLPALMASGRMLAMTALDAKTGDIVGGGILHHLDAERAIVEIGYWVLPHARRRGIATQIARLLAEHAFALGVERVAAYVNVDNPRPSACSSVRASRARGSSGRCRSPTAGASTRRCSRCCPASERAAAAGRARRPEGRRARVGDPGALVRPGRGAGPRSARRARAREPVRRVAPSGLGRPRRAGTARGPRAGSAARRGRGAAAWASPSA
jgi:Acetyltransferase (GNAT) domain